MSHNKYIFARSEMTYEFMDGTKAGIVEHMFVDRHVYTKYEK